MALTRGSGLCVDVNYSVAMAAALTPPLSLVFGNHGNPPCCVLYSNWIDIVYSQTFDLAV